MSSTSELTTMIRHLGLPAGDAAGDRELLDRYARTHDQSAFATLVQRYGPLVLGVARRQAGDRHRAEDVFQATFLALARSAAKLVGRPVLANWLYTVALRQARKARAARRKALELAAPTRPRVGGEVARTFPHTNVVFAAAISPDGKNLVGGGYDREKNVYFARVWDAETGKELRQVPFGNCGIRCITYSRDGKTVAVGGDSGGPLSVKLFDAKTGKERLAIPFPDASSVHSVAFSPDGKTLAASGGSSTRLFDAATGKEVLKIDRKATGLRFAPDGATLVGAVTGTIYRWDAATGKSLIPKGGDSPVAQVVVSADGKRIVTRGQDGDAHVWDARTGEHLRRVNVSWQRGLALSPDGRFLVWPETDETIRFKVENEPNVIFTGNRLRMLDLTTGKLVERFGGFEGDADNLFFTAGGKTLVTVDHRDATVRF